MSATLESGILHQTGLPFNLARCLCARAQNHSVIIEKKLDFQILHTEFMHQFYNYKRKIACMNYTRITVIQKLEHPVFVGPFEQAESRL